MLKSWNFNCGMMINMFETNIWQGSVKQFVIAHRNFVAVLQIESYDSEVNAVKVQSGSQWIKEFEPDTGE